MRRCFVTRQSLQDVLRSLRTAALVGDADEPRRGRSRALALTAAGERRLGEAHTVVTGIERDMLTGLGARDRDQLAALLLRCAQNLEAASKTGIAR